MEKLIRIFLRIPNNPVKKVLSGAYYSEVVSERILEYPLTFSFLNYRGGKEKRSVVDIGCYYSSLPIQLASMGFSVTGIDLNDYLLEHPNLEFLKGDIRKLKIGRKFDIAISISTIEHIGLGYYDEKVDNKGDKEAVDAVYKILKPNGVFVMTVPFGKLATYDSYRSYNWRSLEKLVDQYNLKKVLFFKSVRGKWVPAKRVEVETVSNRGFVRGFAFVLATK